MKKLFSLVAIIAIIASANCSRIEQNEDPIIGIWFEAKTISEGNTSKTTIRKEWIFNDVYLGRYHEIDGNNITLKTDFPIKVHQSPFMEHYSNCFFCL